MQAGETMSNVQTGTGGFSFKFLGLGFVSSFEIRVSNFEATQWNFSPK
jgi:hypothetical protein